MLGKTRGRRVKLILIVYFLFPILAMGWLPNIGMYMLPHVPEVYAEPPPGGSATLWCNDFDEAQTGWSEMGDSPYLDDNMSNYITTSSSGADESAFFFENTTATDFDSVKIYIYGHGDIGAYCRVKMYVDNGTGYQYLGYKTFTASDEWYYYELYPDIVDTQEEVNGLKLYLEALLFTSTAYVYKSKLYLWKDSPPTYGESFLLYNNTNPEWTTEFRIKLYDDIALSHSCLSHNNSGAWENTSWTELGGTWSYVYNYVTLNKSVGQVVGWKWYFNDTAGNWNWTNTYTLTIRHVLYQILDYLDDSVIDWTESMDTKYMGMGFSRVSKTLFGGYINQLTDWKDILIWSARAKKLGIEKENQIKKALNESIMLADGLPKSGSGDQGDYFSVYDRELLWGYYWAIHYSYNLTKWNITTAYNNFRTGWINNGSQGFLHYYNTSYVYVYNVNSPRFYDEAAQTLSCFLLFHEFNVTGALEDAEEQWTYINNNHWTGSYFKYRPDNGCYECASGGFLQIIALLKYFNNTIGNSARLFIDAETRFLDESWYSPQWSIGSNPYYAVVHANPGNSQRRLANTIMAWASIFGTSSFFDTATYANFTNLLSGYSGFDPAYSLLLNETCGLFNVTSNNFREWSTGSESNLATARGASLLFMLGIVPVNATLAVPLEELHYQYIYNILDPDLFKIDVDYRNLTLSIYFPGHVKFMYNASVYQYFSQNGTYRLHFNNDWTSISSCDRIGDLPDRKYLMEAFPPELSQTGTNETEASMPCDFHTFAETDLELSHAEFYWNYTETMEKNGTMSLSGQESAVNFTRTLPPDSCVLAWFIVVNDTNNQWGNTTTQYLQVQAWHDVEDWSIALNATASWNLVETWDFTLNGTATWEDVEDWNLQLNATGSWVFVETWNFTLNSTGVWNLVETWQFTLNGVASWNIVETWFFTLNSTAAWMYVETWQFSLNGTASWKEVETWNFTLDSGGGWHLVETWNCTLNSTGSWENVEIWEFQLNATADWHLVETWNYTLSSDAWNLVETWHCKLSTNTPTPTVTCHLPCDTNIPDGLKVHFGDVYWASTQGSDMKITAWFESNWVNYTASGGTQKIHNGTKPSRVYFDDVEQSEGSTWTYSLGTITITPAGTDIGVLWGEPPLDWHLVETWNFSLHNVGSWHDVENWNIELNATGSWNLVETWNFSLSTSAQWHLVETWNFTLNGTGTWNDVEIWDIALNATGSWELVETWNFSLTTSALWNLVETWNFTLNSTGQWEDVEEWNIQLNATSDWHHIETWNFTLDTHVTTWHDVEDWTIQLNSTSQWVHVETWAFTSSTFPMIWHDIEDWMLNLTTRYDLYLYGAFWENGYDAGSINVTFYRPFENPLSFELNSSNSPYHVSVVPNRYMVFNFELGYNESRTYYAYYHGEHIYVFKPDQPYYIYFFDVVDYAGITNGYLESRIHVNGTERVVERWRLDVVNDIPFAMSWGNAYKMVVVCDQGTHEFGEYVAGPTTDYTLVITKDMFPQPDITTENITVTTSRVSDTTIQLNFTDTDNKTAWACYEIYTDQTRLYQNNVTGYPTTQNWEWTYADPTQDYHGVLTIMHDDLGTQSWTYSYPTLVSPVNPWSLDWLGTWVFNSNQLIGFIIVALVFAAGNYANAPAVMLLAVIIAAILVVIGFLGISTTWLGISFGIALIAAVSIARSRHERTMT